MRVFVSVGTQLPFDRLVQAVEQWASLHPEAEVFAQVGPSCLVTPHLRTMAFVSPEEFRAQCQAAEVVVAHAGTGVIFAALELGKPIVVMPRQLKLGEHRNNHQLATVEHLRHLPGVNVAWDAAELCRLLDHPERLRRPGERITSHASPQLLEAIARFVNHSERKPQSKHVEALLCMARWRGRNPVPPGPAPVPEVILHGREQRTSSGWLCRVCEAFGRLRAYLL